MLDEPRWDWLPSWSPRSWRSSPRSTKQAASVLLIEQNARAASPPSGLRPDSGKVTLEGSAAELQQDPQVVAAYPGA
jgi:branched-chain amino acid transport system ATP-binding protein